MVDLYVTSLGSAYIGICTVGHTLESVVEEAQLLERRHIRLSTMPDPYGNGGSRTVSIHDMQQPIFQIGSINVQIGSTS